MAKLKTKTTVHISEASDSFTITLDTDTGKKLYNFSNEETYEGLTNVFKALGYEVTYKETC